MTEQQIDDFSAFAKSRLAAEGETSIDRLYDEWREQTPSEEDRRALSASLRDMEQGERGRPFEEFAREFREKHRIRDGR